MYHKDTPWGKGLWVWDLRQCLGGDIDAVVKKCKDYDISYVIYKGGDGEFTYPTPKDGVSRPPQLTADVVTKFHSAGIKIYSWTYNYGLTPLAEAAVAIKCLDLGVDGHVFDAELEYEHLANNAHAAETMLQMVRNRYPDTFLAYSTYPIIDYHKDFPYLSFGKYCDAVMPQVYYGDWRRTPQAGILWMYDNFVRWQQNWIDNGHGESVKPIIPTGQAFDNSDPKVLYVTKPEDIHAFINTVSGYKSVNFWSFQHILRDDCWEELRDAKVDPPSDADLGRVITASEPQEPVQAVTEAPVEAVVESPTVFVPEEVEAVETVETTTYEPIIETTSTQPDGTTVTVVEQVEAPIPEGVTVIVPEEVLETPIVPVETPTVTPQTNPQTVDLPGKVNIPIDGKTTITVKQDSSHPDGMTVTVVNHKTHRDIFLEFVAYIISLLKRKK